MKGRTHPAVGGARTPTLATESQQSRSRAEVASCSVSAERPQRTEASEPQGYLTIRAGGPFDGAVTVATIGGGRGRAIVIVSWLSHGHARWDTVEVASFEQGLAVARTIADQLAAGQPPRRRANAVAPRRVTGLRSASRGIACGAGIPRVPAVRRSLRCAEGKTRGGTT